MERLIDDPEGVFTERVAGRRTIYLDTNAWSDLSEEKTETAKAASRLAKIARERRVVVFPLSYATITEFLKRHINDDSERQADLMDSLSDGVTFRGPEPTRDLEVLRAYEYLAGLPIRCRKSEMFTATACYIGDRPIVFPPGWTDAAADELVSNARSDRSMTLRFLQQKMRSEAFLKSHEKTDQKYVEEISRRSGDAMDWARDRNGKLNAERLRDEEQVFNFKVTLMGNLPRLVGLSGMELIDRNLGNIVRKPGRRTLRPLIEMMPSVWLSCEMHVQRALSTHETTEKQDFYDHEHAALAVPYTDALVTSDGRLLDILRKARVKDRYSCSLLRGVVGLKEYLERIL